VLLAPNPTLAKVTTMLKKIRIEFQSGITLLDSMTLLRAWLVGELKAEIEKRSATGLLKNYFGSFKGTAAMQEGSIREPQIRMSFPECAKKLGEKYTINGTLGPNMFSCISEVVDVPIVMVPDVSDCLCGRFYGRCLRGRCGREQHISLYPRDQALSGGYSCERTR
jgi:hypothetical protein